MFVLFESAVQMSPLFPKSLMVGMELRDKVCVSVLMYLGLISLYMYMSM